MQPTTFAQTVIVILCRQRTLSYYWIEIVELHFNGTVTQLQRNNIQLCWNEVIYP